MRRFSRPAAVCCLLAVALISSAAAAERAPSNSGFSQPSTDYLFVPGDVLDITVKPQEGYDRTVTVQPDGKIVFPVVGEVMAAGLTVAELTRRLQKGLELELKRPQVTVSLKEINRGVLRRVSVLGAVKSQGVYELKEKATLAEVLATAGGPLPVADLRRVTITRSDGTIEVADLSQAARTGQIPDNVVLRPGDLIYLPEGVPPTVQVLGEVAKPGTVELQGEMRVLDALSQAGGPNQKADLRRLTLTRQGEAKPRIIDLQSLLTRGQQEDLSANILLEPGDTLVLPESERKYYVLGEVTKADAYPLKEGDRLLDALTSAGGSSKEADLSRVMVIRRGEDGQPVARRVDLKNLMKKGDMARNELLQEGDVIFVPDRPRKRSLGEYASFIYPFTGLLSVLRFY